MSNEITPMELGIVKVYWINRQGKKVYLSDMSDLYKFNTLKMILVTNGIYEKYKHMLTSPRSVATTLERLLYEKDYYDDNNYQWNDSLDYLLK